MLIVEVDGSSRANPGPAGIGVRLRVDQQVVKEISRSIGIRTNNQAEYEAMLCGLAEAINRGAADAIIFTDSALVYNQLVGRFKVRDEHLKPLYERCRSLLDRLPGVRLRLVSRQENKAADKLAQAASHTASSTLRPAAASDCQHQDKA
ncbi:MAG: ribonuclease HI family protein [candidate division WOR-3 bacterium]